MSLQARESEARKQSQIMVNFPVALEDIEKDQHLIGNADEIKEESSSSDDGK